MKTQHWLALGLLLAGSMSLAASIQLEDRSAFGPLPAAVDKAIRAYPQQAYSDEVLENCKLMAAPVVLGSGPDADALVVGTGGCGGGSASFPLWVVLTDAGSPKVLLSDGAVAVEVLASQSNGLHDLSLHTGNAGHCSRMTYRFNGQRYQPQKTAKCR